MHFNHSLCGWIVCGAYVDMYVYVYVDMYMYVYVGSYVGCIVIFS